jgi:hypothetical protein
MSKFWATIMESGVSGTFAKENEKTQLCLLA